MSVPIQSSLESRTPMMSFAAVQLILAIGLSCLMVAAAAGGDVFEGLEDKTYLGEFKFTTHEVQGQVCKVVHIQTQTYLDLGRKLSHTLPPFLKQCCSKNFIK